jgi:hypothetical protein
MLLAILPNWNSLDSVRRAHSDLELAGLVFFALLVVAEALAHNSKQEDRKHLFDSIGIWFFAIAVVCEIAGYWYGQRNDALSEQVIVSLDVKARDAASNASTALDKSGTALSNSKEAETKSGDALAKAGQAHEEARAVENRLTIASGQLAKMQHQLSLQGPRWKILEDRKKEFIEALKPFAGQKLTVVQCGPKPGIEEAMLANDIIAFLGGADGAGWITVGDVWMQCSGVQFFSTAVMTAHAVDSSAFKAEIALIDAMNNRLGIMASDFPDFPISVWQRIAPSLLAHGAPLDLVLNDPTRIVLLIGPNPMVDVPAVQLDRMGNNQSINKQSH